VTLDQLERQRLFRRAFWKRNFYLFCALSLGLSYLAVLACLRVHVNGHEDTLLGYAIGVDVVSWGTLLRVGIFIALQVGLGQYYFYKSLHGDGRVPLYPEDKSGERTFGGLRGPEIVGMVQTLARNFGVGKIARIIVSENPDPNAYTARVFGLGNVVVLHSNLLQVLPPEGVRSVIAHEVGHIRRKDSLLYQLLSLPRMLALIIALLVCMKIAGAVLEANGVLQFLMRAGSLCFSLWLLITAFHYLERLFNLASQQTELMVDAYAAQTCGWETHLNALLLIGERAEALTVFMEALKAAAERTDEALTEKSVLRILNRLPPGELDEDRARLCAPGLFIVDRLDALRKGLCVPLTDEQIGDLASRATEALEAVKA
jgi:Zn-dependent protease with chaperone function